MTNNYQNITEFISTAKGTEGSLLIVKKIYDTLIDETAKRMIDRSECAIYFGPDQIPGSSLDFDLLTPNSLNVREIGEYSGTPMDTPAWTSFNMKPKKYGVGLRITKEMLEDGKWNLLQNAAVITGRRMAENENSLIIAQLDNAANTVSGGAAITIANMTRAIQYLEDSDYDATSMGVGNEVANDIRNIDTFTEVNKSGSDQMLKTGFIGVIYGMRVFRVSTNAGMTTTNAYVWDKAQGYIVGEKRPVTVEGFKLPLLDSEGVSVTQRIIVRYLRSSAICKVTTS